MKAKSTRQFIRENREELTAAIQRAHGNWSPTYRLNDKEREQWILNDEGLYRWAKSEGVKI